MFIPVTFNPGSSSPTSLPNSPLPLSLAQISHSEIVLVELQGSLEVDLGTAAGAGGAGGGGVAETKDGKFIGKLTVDETNASAKPTLRIGTNLLEGKIVSLAKPLAVLVRRRTEARTTSSSSPPPSHDPISQEEGQDDGGSMDIDADVDVDDGDDAMATTRDRDVNDEEEVTSAHSRPVSISRRQASVRWEAVAVVKRKIIFPKRPMLIVGRPS